MGVAQNLDQIKNSLPKHVTLVAVSKTHPAEAVLEAYKTGHRVFGENKVQEMVDKAAQLPTDIEWHLIGHLQTNKIKYIAPFVSLIHSVDSLKVLKEINKQASKHSRVIPVLLQVHIASEETKFGFSEEELLDLTVNELQSSFPNVLVKGLMGMATNTDDEAQVRKEFATLNKLYQTLMQTFSSFNTLCMGMSGDYKIAIEEGSNMVRIGTAIFGSR
jgi:pyridoxal phosphate enzyme (YggS family)